MTDALSQYISPRIMARSPANFVTAGTTLPPMKLLLGSFSGQRDLVFSGRRGSFEFTLLRSTVLLLFSD
ncbi:hypothetical protein PanWU01x14_067370 [Parasponia andersonii]|uniref:Uncharacterized protein n=1 Tax=Parasponia andersonii TaxID=3476 RepID=A0A2P5DGF6_PARAD|nr:hypothetical protein PanWU01x14_067370 [Parasponia andersonii]